MKETESAKYAVITPVFNGTRYSHHICSECDGKLLFEKSIIELSETFGTEHQKRCQILWHEILHGIIENNGMKVKNEEAVVDMFAKGIYQVLQDNGARFFDIRCDEKGGE